MMSIYIYIYIYIPSGMKLGLIGEDGMTKKYFGS